MLWFVNQGRKTEGPMPEQRVAQLIAWGKISRGAYVCDEQLSSWVSIQRTAFAPLFAPVAPTPPAAEAEDVRLLGALRGGPWRCSTRALQRLGACLAAASVFAGALELANGLAAGAALGANQRAPVRCLPVQR
jgi:hypothetical protein